MAIVHQVAKVEKTTAGVGKEQSSGRPHQFNHAGKLELSIRVEDMPATHLSISPCYVLPTEICVPKDMPENSLQSIIPNSLKQEQPKHSSTTEWKINCDMFI